MDRGREPERDSKIVDEILQVERDNGRFVPLLETYKSLIRGKDEAGVPRWLDKPPKDTSVIVVGAGISGLLSAKLLKAAGFRVTVLEANPDRIGGRIRTFCKERDKESHAFRCEYLYGEAGAMRIPQSHPLVNTLIESLGLRMEPFHNQDVEGTFYDEDRTQDALDDDEVGRRIADRDNCDRPKAKRTWRYVNGKRIRVSQMGDQSQDDWKTFLRQFDLRDDTGTPGVLLDKALDTIEKELNANPDKIDAWTKIVQEHRDTSNFGFLSKELRGDRALVDYVGTFENLKSRFSLSFLHYFINRQGLGKRVPLDGDRTEFEHTPYREIPGGMWQLPYRMLEAATGRDGSQFRLEELIVRDARVIEIARDGDELVLTTTNNPKYSRSKVRNADRHKQVFTRKFYADYLVLTLPFAALRWVKVAEGLFEPRKRRAIEALHYDSATKVLLEFSRRFWEWDSDEWERHVGRKPKDFRGHNRSSGGHSIVDLPNRFVYYPSHRTVQTASAGSNVDGFRTAIKEKRVCRGGVVLASYTFSDEANRWDSIADEERLRLALDGLVELYGPEIKQFYTGYGATKSWMSSSFSGGEAAVFTPGQIDLHPDIIEPAAQNRIHFAGEHASLKHAWIEGALESAIRAARAIAKDASGK